jgi:UDP-N-acetylglucosamine:LPS N-acetylglucosamine transferase
VCRQQLLIMARNARALARDDAAEAVAEACREVAS